MRMRRLGAAIAVAMMMACFAWVGAATTPRAVTPPPNDDVATVGPDHISRADFETRWTDSERQYREHIGSELPREYRSTARRQILELMIRQRLAMLESRRLGLGGTSGEAEALLRQDPRFNPGGHFDEALWRAARDANPNQFQHALQEMQGQLGARKLAAQFKQESTPTEDELRPQVSRRLTRALIGMLALRRGEFDGGYPEPTEAEMLDAYRKHAGEHMLPEEFRFSTVFVNAPTLPDSLAIRSDARRAWNQRMQQRADSALAAIRGGASLERVAASFGSIQPFSVQKGGRFPSWWHGDIADQAQVLALASGRVAPRSFPIELGQALIRLDQRLPARPAPIKDVAVELRSRLRRDARAYREDRELAALYAALRDSLAGPASPVRFAVADTSTFPVVQPTDEQLRALYKERLSDFTQVEEGTGEVVTASYNESKRWVYVYWVSTKRAEALNAAAARLMAQWSAGRRDPAAEQAMSFVRDAGPVPHGGLVDTSLAGISLTDSLRALKWTPGVHLVHFKRGLIVAQVGAEIPRLQPTLVQARPMLAERLGAQYDREIERGARQLFASDPQRFRQGRTWYFTRVVVPTPDILDVPLTHDEVQRAYDQHIADYGTPEEVHILHLLISPADSSPAADARARARAESLLVRARAGENFAALARQSSDDIATREDGGDVGTFRRGSMLPQFENAAFRLRPGEISDLVRTEVGYHILRCVDHWPSEVTPLSYCYPNVASDLAQRRAEGMARARADSLRRSLRTPAQGRASAEQLGYILINNEHPLGEHVLTDLVHYFKTLETLKPGEIHPEVQLYRGLGFVVTWMDSVADSRMLTWEESRLHAREVWQADASQRAMVAKRAELDSMGRAGWSFDSLTTLFGGTERRELDGPGTVLRQLGTAPALDSLVFGVRDLPPALAVGEASEWETLAGGELRFKLVERRAPEAFQLAARLNTEVEAETDRRVSERYDKLKARFPVAILDPLLVAVRLPQTPKP